MRRTSYKFGFAYFTSTTTEQQQPVSRKWKNKLNKGHQLFSNFFQQVFLPQGYPNTVHPDYTSYQIWDTVQVKFVLIFFYSYIWFLICQIWYVCITLGCLIIFSENFSFNINKNNWDARRVHCRLATLIFQNGKSKVTNSDESVCIYILGIRQYHPWCSDHSFHNERNRSRRFYSHATRSCYNNGFKRWHRNDRKNIICLVGRVRKRHDLYIKKLPRLHDSSFWRSTSMN